jgi:hypothetical protein
VAPSGPPAASVIKMKKDERSRDMHPAPARETTLAGRPEAKHSVGGVADIDRLIGNGVWAHDDATPLIFNDADQQCPAPDVRRILQPASGTGRPPKTKSCTIRAPGARPRPASEGEP